MAAGLGSKRDTPAAHPEMMVVVGSTLVAGSATWPQTSDVAAVAGSMLAGVLSDTKASDAARTSEVAAFAGSGASGSAQCQRRFRYRKRANWAIEPQRNMSGKDQTSPDAQPECAEVACDHPQHDSRSRRIGAQACPLSGTCTQLARG